MSFLHRVQKLRQSFLSRLSENFAALVAIITIDCQQFVVAVPFLLQNLNRSPLVRGEAFGDFYPAQVSSFEFGRGMSPVEEKLSSFALHVRSKHLTLVSFRSF